MTSGISQLRAATALTGPLISGWTVFSIPTPIVGLLNGLALSLDGALVIALRDWPRQAVAIALGAVLAVAMLARDRDRRRAATPPLRHGERRGGRDPVRRRGGAVRDDARNDQPPHRLSRCPSPTMRSERRFLAAFAVASALIAAAYASRSAGVDSFASWHDEALVPIRQSVFTQSRSLSSMVRVERAVGDDHIFDAPLSDLGEETRVNRSFCASSPIEEATLLDRLDVRRIVSAMPQRPEPCRSPRRADDGPPSRGRAG